MPESLCLSCRAPISPKCKKAQLRCVISYNSLDKIYT
jgi:hypothetical protein